MVMLPDKRIHLFSPDGTDYPLWATVVDLGGRDMEIEFTEAGIWRTRFEFSWNLYQTLIDETWTVTDHYGREHTVESVVEPTNKRKNERKVFVIGRRT